MWQFISQYWWIILLVGAMFFMHRPGGMHGGHGGHDGHGGGGGCCGGGHSVPRREKSPDSAPFLKKTPSGSEEHSHRH